MVDILVWQDNINVYLELMSVPHKFSMIAIQFSNLNSIYNSLFRNVCEVEYLKMFMNLYSKYQLCGGHKTNMIRISGDLR